ncbi:MAG: hypothetical protein JW829_20280 [Pirellulales bacterium]|nr:hypothetical protein [Pirellulales bacterium]
MSPDHDRWPDQNATHGHPVRQRNSSSSADLKSLSLPDFRNAAIELGKMALSRSQRVLTCLRVGVLRLTPTVSANINRTCQRMHNFWRRLSPATFRTIFGYTAKALRLACLLVLFGGFTCLATASWLYYSISNPSVAPQWRDNTDAGRLGIRFTPQEHEQLQSLESQGRLARSLTSIGLTALGSVSILTVCIWLLRKWLRARPFPDGPPTGLPWKMPHHCHRQGDKI